MKALELATEWLSKIRDTDPRKLAFFLQAAIRARGLTGFLGQSVWHAQIMPPHGGFLLRQLWQAAGLLYDWWLLLGVW